MDKAANLNCWDANSLSRIGSSLGCLCMRMNVIQGWIGSLLQGYWLKLILLDLCLQE